MDYFGTKDKGSAIFSAEYRPTENLHFYLDTMYSKRDDKMTRMDYDWSVRNGGMIPLNMTVDKSDCSDGCRHRRYLRQHPELLRARLPPSYDMKGFNPGMEWKITPTLKLDAQLNYTKSNFTHEAPTVYLITPPNSGNTVTYTNKGGVPSVVSTTNLNDPNSYVWNTGRVNIQNEFRETKTKGFHSDLTCGDEKFNLKGGVAYDDITRRIGASDNSAAWQAAVCGNNPSVFLQGPNGAPACNGASTPGASAAALYPGYGTGYTAGATTPLTYGGSLIRKPRWPATSSLARTASRSSTGTASPRIRTTSTTTTRHRPAAPVDRRQRRLHRREDHRLVPRGQRQVRPGRLPDPLQRRRALCAHQAVGGVAELDQRSAQRQPAAERQQVPEHRPVGVSGNHLQQHAAFGHAGDQPAQRRGGPRRAVAQHDPRRPECAASRRELLGRVGRYRHHRQPGAEALPVG
jgi:hypothetical protein